MNRERLRTLIRKKDTQPMDEDLPMLRELTESFPYFSSAYVLMTKALHRQSSIYFDKNLHLAACYTGDREVLYHFLHTHAEEEVAAELEQVAAQALEPSQPVYTPAVNWMPQISEAVAEEHQAVAEQTGIIPGTGQHLVDEVQTVSAQAIPEVDHQVEEVAVTEDTIQPEAIALPEEPVAEMQVSEEEVDEQVPTTLAGEMTAPSGDTVGEKVKWEEAGPEVSAQGYLPGTEAEAAEPKQLADAAEPENWQVMPEDEPFVKADEPALQEAEALSEKEAAPTEASQPEVPVIHAEKIEFNEEKPSPAAPSIPTEVMPLAGYDYFAFLQKGKTNREARKQAAKEAEAQQHHEPLVTEHQPVGTAKEHSFSEWFSLLSSASQDMQRQQMEIKPEVAPQPKEAVKEQQPVAVKKPAHQDIDSLISKFIEAEPRIRPKNTKFFNPEDMAQRSASEDYTMATETLANIFIKQELFEKAIEIFQQLRLRYPQKSDYFASKIEELKNKTS